MTMQVAVSASNDENVALRCNQLYFTIEQV